MAERMFPANPITRAAAAVSRIGANRVSAGASSSENFVAAIDSTIISSGTPVDSTQVSTSRWTRPGRRNPSGIPPRSAATATGRSTRSACR